MSSTGLFQQQSLKQVIGPQTVNHYGQLAAVTISFGLAAMSVGPLARMLHLAAFPARWWFPVLAVATATTCWSEPLKSRSARRRQGR